MTCFRKHLLPYLLASDVCDSPGHRIMYCPTIFPPVVYDEEKYFPGIPGRDVYERCSLYVGLWMGVSVARRHMCFAVYVSLFVVFCSAAVPAHELCEAAQWLEGQAVESSIPEFESCTATQHA